MHREMLDLRLSFLLELWQSELDPSGPERLLVLYCRLLIFDHLDLSAREPLLGDKLSELPSCEQVFVLWNVINEAEIIDHGAH